MGNAPQKTGGQISNLSPNIICGKCQVALTDRKVRFQYLGHEFFASVPCCPNCGYVYLSEELVAGKIAEVEETLEDK